MNKGLSGILYMAYFFVMIVFIYPEVETRISALSITGGLASVVGAIPLIILIVALIVPAAFLVRD